MMAINQVCHERQLPIDIVLEAVEVALVSAYKRNFGGNQSITAQIDARSGEPLIYIEKVVVSSVDIENEKREIQVKEAQKVKPGAQLGEMVSVESTPKNFGRIAAQTAKQVILQRIREAERDALYAAYAEREGEIVSGTVHKVDPHQVTISLGKAEAVLPRSEWVPTETYREGQRLRAYVASVNKTNRGPQIVVSRTHRTMLRRLLEVEVPEIYNGTVEIKSIAREAGYRSKVAVAALQEGVDPVGSCVGMRGTRIQNIVNELNGEKIDVVQWNPDLSFFIANSLSPAKVMNVMLSDDQGKTAGVVVPDKQLSLAIGKEGQNARLAAKLTGWRIDIKSASEAVEEAIRHAREDKTIKERMAAKADQVAAAEIILHSKVPIEFTDGELNVLSQLIESVNLAYMAVRRERVAAVEAARKAVKSRDILAEAEAILVGKAPRTEEEKQAASDEIAETEAVEEPVELESRVVETRAAVVSEVDDLMAEAEALLAGVDIEEKPAVEAAVVEPEVVTLSGAEPPKPEEKQVSANVAVAAEKPADFKELFKRQGWQGDFEVEGEAEVDDEERERELEKKKARSKKRRLVYDERLGEVVSERRRKNSRTQDNWLDYDED
jgi:N utilization substance protein A